MNLKMKLVLVLIIVLTSCCFFACSSSNEDDPTIDGDTEQNEVDAEQIIDGDSEQTIDGDIDESVDGDEAEEEKDIDIEEEIELEEELEIEEEIEVEQEVDEEITALPLWENEDFEDANIDDWEKRSEAHTCTVDQTTAAEGTAYSLLMEKVDSDSHYQGLRRIFRPMKPCYVGFWVYADTCPTTGRQNNFRLESTVNTTENFLLDVYFGDGELKLNLGSSEKRYKLADCVEKTWISVGVDINWDDRKMSVYVDSSSVLDDVELDFPYDQVVNVDSLQLWHYSNSSIGRFDQLYITEDCGSQTK